MADLIRGRERHTGRRWPCDVGGTDGIDESTSQRTPRTLGKHRKLEEARKDSSLPISK